MNNETWEDEFEDGWYGDFEIRSQHPPFDRWQDIEKVKKFIRTQITKAYEQGKIDGKGASK